MPTVDPVTTRVGPGYLYFAPLGTAEPASPTAVIDPAYIALGYTEAGSVWNVDMTVVPLHVEESYDPVRTLVTQRLMHMDFALAQISPTNLRIALNNASTSVTSMGGFSTYEPLDIGNETRGMLLWQSGSVPIDEMILVRQVLQTGNIAIQRKKANLSVINIKFQAEIPATGLKPWKRWTNDTAFA